ncbi:MAG TPA: hypothetical protein VN442_12680 [Bryobacteraceae bacterium]|nr:hypothetical protein [Bryobacteraceae bacterium]
MGAEIPLPGVAAEHRELVLAELERVLGSAAFRGSKRSQEFLRYVVTNALNNRPELLKERCIGAEIFGRPADYDTGDDSIVRVKASEVRKRLAQYYGDAGSASGIHIEIPSGSYTPEFRVAAPAAGPVPRTAWRRYWLPLTLLVIAAAGVTVATWLLRPAGALDRFWEPVLRSQQPVLLCVAHPVVYSLAGKARDAMQLPPEQRPPQIATAEIVRHPDHYVGVGDALTAANLAGFFGRRGKAAQVRIGTDTSFSDLRKSPAVLIGAFTNQWTMMMDDLRFVFEREPAGPVVRDRMNPAQRWAHESTTPPSDYVIISRVFDSRTGEVLVVAAGLSHFGTQGAGEFLTNPEYLEQALKGAPADWHSRNMQLVLRAEVIENTPGPPKVMARWFW